MDNDSSGATPDDAQPPDPDHLATEHPDHLAAGDPDQADRAPGRPEQDDPDLGDAPTAAMQPSVGLFPHRSAHDRYLGGVAGGIAERFGIDPFAPRAAFLGATLFAAYAADWIAIVPFLYTGLWLLLPGPSGHSLLRTIRHRSSVREAVAAVASFVVIAIMLTRPVFGFALALAALAWVLLSDEKAGPPGPSLDVAMADAPRVDAARSVVPGTTAPATSQGASNRSTRSSWGRARRSERGEKLVSNFAQTPRRARREPALWPLTLGLLAMVVIGGFMADAILDQGLDPAIMVNLAMLAVGAVIAISAWRGRAMGTALLAVALLPAWIGFSVADIGRFDGSGSANYRPTEVPASGELSYENGYGSMTIDLRDLPLEDAENLSVQIGATAGMVTVLAPFDADLVLRSKVGFGTTQVRGGGLGFYEYDREPFLDRYMVRRYDAHGSSCIPDYWSSWALLVSQHQAAGIDLAGLSATEEADVTAILEAIAQAGFGTPVPVNEEFPPFRPQVPTLETSRTLDEFGNEVLVVVDEFEHGPPLTVINEYEDGTLLIVDEFGNEFQVSPDSYAVQAPVQQLVGDRTWSYSGGVNGEPCTEQPPSNNPATIEIDATIGVGTLEVHRDEF